MKIQRTLGTLWLAAFLAGPCYWLWEFVERSAPAYDRMHALLSLLCLFGAIASIGLFCGAKWARFSIGIIALFFAVAVGWDIYKQGPIRADKSADYSLFVFSVASLVLLLFPRHKPVA